MKQHKWLWIAIGSCILIVFGGYVFATVVVPWRRAVREEEAKAAKRQEWLASMAMREKAIRQWYPDAPRRLAFIDVHRELPSGIEVVANGLRFEKASAAWAHKPAITFTVKNLGTRPVDDLFEREHTVPFKDALREEDLHLYADELKAASDKYEKAAIRLPHPPPVTPFDDPALPPQPKLKGGETKEHMVRVSIPATQHPTPWFTMFVFRKDLATDCDAIVVLAYSDQFYEYQYFPRE
jgi:hypothetical protein